GLVPGCDDDNQAYYQFWKDTVVEQDVGDWNLCARCFAAIRPYFSGDPAPMGIDKAHVDWNAGIGRESGYREQQGEGRPLSRRAGGSTMGELIAKGFLDSRAGVEKIGHFDPETAPFRAFPNERLYLTRGHIADRLARKLGLSSPGEVPDVFQTVMLRK